MRTKIYLLLIALVTTIGSVFGQTAGDTFTYEGVNYRVLADVTTVEVIRTEYSGALTIPSTVTYEGTDYAVKSIASSAFSYNDKLTSVLLSEGIETIGNSAFMGNHAFESFNIPASLTTIGVSVFRNVPNLTITTALGSTFSVENGVLFSPGKTQVLYYPPSKPENTYELPNTIVSFDMYVFYTATNLEYFTVENGSSSFIERDGVIYNTNASGRTLVLCAAGTTVTNFVVPDDLNVVGFSVFAFWGCKNIESMFLPATVTGITNASSLRACDNLVHFELAAGHPYTVGSDGVIFANDGKTLVLYPPGKRNDSYEIPATVESIDPGAFMHNPYLKSVTIPGSVEDIGNLAFYGCINLREIVFLGDPPTSIGNGVFDGIPEDAYVIVPEGSKDDYVTWADNNNLPFTNIYGAADVDVTSDEPLKFIDKETGEVLDKLPQINTGKEYTILPEDDEKYEVESVTVGGLPITKGTDDEFHVTLNGDMEIEVVIVPKKVVTFISDGSTVETQYVKNEARASSPAVSKAGYTLRGWNEVGSTALYNFSTPVTVDFTLTARWTEILTKYTVTIQPLAGVTVNKAGGEVNSGYNYGFNATANANGYRVIVYVNGEELASTSDNFYLIEGITENKTVTFALTAGTYNDDSIVGGITVNGEPLDDKKSDFPEEGKIVITFNDDADTNVSGKVIIDGKEVPGTWGTDSNGNPTYTIDYAVEGDGEHTIKIEGFGGDGETHTFTTGGGSGNNGNNTGGGKVVIDDTTPPVLPGEFPGDGEIVVYPPVVNPGTTPEVTIDGEKVVPGGTWGEDENGDPIFTVEYEGLEDGPHSIVIDGKEYTFTVKNGGGATSNDVLSTAKITASVGTVTIETPKTSTVYIVSFSGSVVYNAQVVGTVTVNVPAGIYAVVVDGTAAKVVVR